VRRGIALVTGSASGFGLQACAALHARGFHVYASMRDRSRADAVREAVAARGFDPGEGLEIVELDVDDADAAAALAEHIHVAHGALDVLVNNAGIAGTGEDRERIRNVSETRITEVMTGEITTHWDVTQNMSDEAWHRMIGVHLNGTFFCTREALRLMSRVNRGAIINLSSVAALTGLESVPHYSAAKGGILSFTRAVAREVGSRNIRVNAICPGFIETPMTAGVTPMMQKVLLSRTPLGRWGQPEEIAATALFLASDDASFYTGQWLSPNGGFVIGA
jgi:3-oxoacyl-[acyl-carrier protein] reductase